MEKRCCRSRLPLWFLLAVYFLVIVWERPHLVSPFLVSVTPSSFTTTRRRQHATSSPLFSLVNRPNGHHNQDNNNSKNEPPLPFLIEPLPDTGRVNPSIYADIARMCIAAFFNDGDEEQLKKNTPLWKELQLAYLRNLQSGDLRLRRMERRDSNFMLVARRVVPASITTCTAKNGDASRFEPLILDLSAVQNLPASMLQYEQDFVRGEILGFVEVTQRPYGLGKLESLFAATTTNKNDNTNKDDDEKAPQQKHGSQKYHKRNNENTVRPILTNLSVNYSARRSGLGSALVQRCEEEVIRRWNQKEIVLEVEEDNLRALDFYKKRGYKVLYEDPTSRRYDVSGLWLQKKRCKRYIMRKELSFANSLMNVQPISPQEVKLNWNKGLETLRKLRDNVLAGTNA